MDIMIVVCAVLISAVLFPANYVQSQLSEGDSCRGENGQTWRCKKLQHCDSAKAEIKYKQPKPCGFSADSFIVCCNPKMPPKPGKPPPTENFNWPAQSPTPKPTKKPPQTNLPVTTSQIKCRDYQKYVYKDVNYETLGWDVDYNDDGPKHTSSNNKSTENTCGIKENPLIFDGKPAHPREFPHQVMNACLIMCLTECREYEKYVHKEASNVPLALEVEYEDDESLNTNKNTENTCGRKEEALIYHGKPASPKEFPHQVLLGYEVKRKIQWLCAGSLISERFVLTAAHCIDTENGPPRVVRTGDLDYESNTDRANPQDIRVAKPIMHPGYKNEKPYNDIGLLKLERDVKLDQYSRPACLHYDPQITATDATASGWGFTENGTKSTFLLKVQLDIIDRDKCNDFYTSSRLTVDDRRMICAGDLVGRKDTCRGDSGGPLQIRRPNLYCMYSIIGVTSFGRGLCGTKQPGVYTRVSYYLNWIESQVWP